MSNLRQRLRSIDHQAAQLKRKHGKNKSTWPPEAISRMEEIHARRQRVFSLIRREGR